jgi:hypothetical protein
MVRNGEVSRFGHESYEIGIRMAGWIQKILNTGIRTQNNSIDGPPPLPLCPPYWRGPEVLFLDTRIRWQRGAFRSRFDCRKRLELLSMLQKFLGDLSGWSRET